MTPRLSSQNDKRVFHPHTSSKLHWLDTLIAKGTRPFEFTHLRYRQALTPLPMLHLLALDTSGSMCAGDTLARAKGWVAAFLTHAKRRGDVVAVLSFGGDGVTLLLPPKTVRLSGIERLKTLGGGGGTPLEACLQTIDEVLAHHHHGVDASTCLWLLTDGRSTQCPTRPRRPQQIMIVDCEQSVVKWGRCAAWATQWQAGLLYLSQRLCG